ncbi:hypothetical protein DQ937_21740, partial [Salmonella enterica subsp. enterica serovar Poona]|nr:hypothetical protein [Salmonella enterica subsp. enterica serovar Poona]
MFPLSAVAADTEITQQCDGGGGCSVCRKWTGYRIVVYGFFEIGTQIMAAIHGGLDTASEGNPHLLYVSVQRE